MISSGKAFVNSLAFLIPMKTTIKKIRDSMGTTQVQNIFSIVNLYYDFVCLCVVINKT